MESTIIKNVATIRPIPDHKKLPGVYMPKVLTDEEILARGWSLERMNRFRRMIKELPGHRARATATRKNGQHISAQ